MIDTPSVAAEALRLDKARQTLASLRGARGEISARLDEIATQVAVSKGRIGFKGQVDAFLEDLQADAHKRNVGSFERLLTLLTRDVLPGSAPIGLELSTERGLPSLDVFARLDDNLQEDIYHDQGGAMTNVVSAGLRLIAAVKSGGRRLLVLDEPDCWIKPDRIPDFYRIFRQAADQVGIQCLVISHHPHSLFADGIDIARLDNDDGRTATIVSSETSRTRWSDDTPGFRSIKLTNIQQHASSELQLSPGVTALIGPNNRGKSSVVRALAAALYGDGRESLIRHGETSCAVEIRMEGGRTLTYTRHRRRNPLNMWTLTEADGAVVDEDGIRHETGGRNVPDWIASKIGVAPIDDLRIHVSNQKNPIFLLADPPSRRASVLSVGQETSHLREMITIQRERAVRDQQTVREGEKEIFSLRERLAAMADLDRFDAEIDDASGKLDAVRATAAATDEVEAALSAIEKTTGDLAAARARMDILSDLPSDAERDKLSTVLRDSMERDRAVADIASILASLTAAKSRLTILGDLPSPPDLRPGDEIATLVGMIDAGRRELHALTAMKAVLDEVPDAPPPFVPSDDITAAGKEIGATTAALSASRARLEDVTTGLSEIEAETAVLLETMGNLCPTCGQSVSDAASFLREPHATGTP